MGSQSGKPPVDATPALSPGDGASADPPIEEPVRAAQPTLAEIVDALDDGKEIVYATWEELCEPGGRQKRYRLRNGHYVLYTTFISLEKVAEIRLKAMVGGRFNNARFLALMLKEVLLDPRVESDDMLRNALKADGMALLDIINDVQNLNRAMREAEEEELGES